MRDLMQEYPGLRALLREQFAEFGKAFDEFGCFEPEHNITDISAKSYSGFIPFTNGGLRAMVLSDLRSEYGSGMCGGFAKNILQPYIDDALRDAAYDFIQYRDELAELRDDVSCENADNVLWNWFEQREEAYNAAHASGTLPGIADPGPFWSTPEGWLREEYYDYESEHMFEGGEFWYQLCCHFYAPENSQNVTGEDELYFYAGVNTDFSYGRDKGLECSYARLVKCSEITPELIETIVAEAIDSIDAEPGKYATD
jgi:hypothetical protein